LTVEISDTDRFEQPGSRQRLMKGDKVLDGEGSKLADLSIEYDDELLLVYQKEGASLIPSLVTQRKTRCNTSPQHENKNVLDWRKRD
jgi:hypothetical protein